LPANIKNVGNYAFDGLDNLVSVKILGNDVLIGREAFHGCKNLEKVEFAGSVEKIDGSAFGNCYALEKVTFGGPVKIIGNSVFSNLTKLSEITLLEGLEEIGSYTFFGCHSLKNITIPSTVKKIGESIFDSRYKMITVVGSGYWHKVYEPGVEQITFLNPQCEIFDSENTIRPPATIYGYNGSTAEKYAEKYDRTFVSLGDYVKPADEEQVRAFVSRMYTVALNRAAEPQGLADWTNRLINHEVDGAGIAHGFILSDEFINRNLSNGDYVDVLYKTFLNRASDPAGKADWVSRLDAGASRKFILAGFVNSVEFDGLCTSYGIKRGTMDAQEGVTGTGVRGFVERLYTKALGRAGEEEGINNWSNAISTGTISAEDAAKNFFFSEEFVNRNLNDADYVETLYQTFMDRASDAAGKASWLTLMQEGMSRNEVLEGFSQSKEFAAILESYGL